MKFDENNISKVIVKFSFILVSVIAFSLIAIYTPKYYYEYRNNTESTKQHLNKLLEESPKLVRLLDQRIHSSCRLFYQSMILIDLLSKNIVHFLLDCFHLSDHILVELVLLLVNICF